MEKFNLFIEMLDNAISNIGYKKELENLLQVQCEVNDNEQLKLGTIIKVCEKYNFTAEIGTDIDNTKTFQEYLDIDKNILTINELYNKLNQQLLIFTNSDKSKIVVYRKVKD